jgi:hypothetical protein
MRSSVFVLALVFCFGLTSLLIADSPDRPAMIEPNVWQETDQEKSELKTEAERGQMMVYTANQTWLSRIYLLRMDGSVYDYHEYEFYRFCDLEVVDGEVYVSEAFAPRMFRVDLETGELDLIVDDWSLYYFYNLAFDGSYFYLNEWDMGRYDINGDKDGTASYDGDVFGSAYDGEYLYNLDEDGVIRCWDVAAWPTITEVSENSFSPPSPNCRGLWFDGQFFWTAESIEGSLGYIYKFDYDGEIIEQWLEPAFQGWGVCVVPFNYPPDMPYDPSPSDDAVDVAVDAALEWSCVDPDGDQVVFDVYVGENQPLPQVSDDQAGSTYKPIASWLHETTYYWQIIGHDVHGDSVVGPIWSFTTEPSYLCGDSDGNDLVNVSDAVFLISYIFGGGPAPDPLAAGDPDCNQLVNVSDAVYLISYIFGGGPEPCASCP